VETGASKSFPRELCQQARWSASRSVLPQGRAFSLSAPPAPRRAMCAKPGCGGLPGRGGRFRVLAGFGAGAATSLWRDHGRTVMRRTVSSLWRANSDFVGADKIPMRTRPKPEGRGLFAIVRLYPRQMYV